MKKILIVDDDIELRATLSEILIKAGYHTDEAASGREAIEKIAYSEYDIVLLDLVMPKISGMDVLTELRRLRPKTRVIMITAFATVENAVEAIKREQATIYPNPLR